MRTAWQEHIGVGSRQAPVRTGTTKRVYVEHEHGGLAGHQDYHPSGRVDATVYARAVKIGKRDGAQVLAEARS